MSIIDYSYGKSVFSLVKNLSTCFPKWLYHFTFLPAMNELLCSTSSLKSGVSVLEFSHSNRCVASLVSGTCFWLVIAVCSTLRIIIRHIRIFRKLVQNPLAVFPWQVVFFPFAGQDACVWVEGRVRYSVTCNIHLLFIIQVLAERGHKLEGSNNSHFCK